jgi:hypothetical protein
VDNGVDVTDDRVMRRTNEATQEILASVLPVNGMMIADIAVTGGALLLPPEMEAATHVQIITDGTVNNQTDVRQGWYDIVNQFTYLDPMAAHDNPLIDNFEVPDPINPSILRRSYTYPGFDAGTVRVTGPKSYQPVTTDDDYLIVQNVPALKLMIQAIERRENLDIEGSRLYKAECIQMLTDEVKGHQMDPRRAMKRKGDYEADLRTYAQSSMGWTRARLALEVPGAMSMGKEEITRLMERAEMLALEMGTWKGTLEEFDATVYGGVVFFPPESNPCSRFPCAENPSRSAHSSSTIWIMVRATGTTPAEGLSVIWAKKCWAEPTGASLPWQAIAPLIHPDRSCAASAN